MSQDERMMGSSFNGAIRNFPKNEKSDFEILAFITRLSLFLLFSVFIVSYWYVKVLSREKMGRDHISELIRGILTFLLFCFGVYLCFNSANLAMYFSEVEYFKRARIIATGIIYLFLAAFTWEKCTKLLDQTEKFNIPDNYPGDPDKDGMDEKKKNFFSMPVDVLIVTPISMILGGGLFGILHPLMGLPFVIVGFFYWIVVIIKGLLGINGYNRKYFKRKFKNSSNSDHSEYDMVN